MNNYYIKNKITGEYFSGFKNKLQVWGDVNASKPYETKLIAETQVLLLNNNKV